MDGDAVLTADVGSTVGKVGFCTVGNGIAIFEDVAVERPAADENVPPDNCTPDNGGTDTTAPATTSGGGSGSGGCFIGVSVRANSVAKALEFRGER
jgi:hypothetical protein